MSLQTDEPFYRKKPFKFTFLPPQEINNKDTPGKGPSHQNCRKVVSPWPHTTHCPRIAAKEKHSMETFLFWNEIETSLQPEEKGKSPLKKSTTPRSGKRKRRAISLAPVDQPYSLLKTNRLKET